MERQSLAMIMAHMSLHQYVSISKNLLYVLQKLERKAFRSVLHLPILHESQEFSQSSQRGKRLANNETTEPNEGNLEEKDSCFSSSTVYAWT